MAMRTLIAIILFVSIPAAAQDQWFCTETSTTRSNDVWTLCGVGEGMSEGMARSRAMEVALYEFKQMCDLDSSCKGTDKDVEPMRTSCTEVNQWWKCYRMIVVRTR